MTVNKIPVCPHKIRQIPEQFSWVDHRLVRERYIDTLSHSTSALYLFLVTVSDVRGLSYYGDASLCKRLNMEEEILSGARNELISQHLLAFKKPLYQVLALDSRREPTASNGELHSMGQILKQMAGGDR